jgi:tetratricopeptide (TPR) repeat protein
LNNSNISYNKYVIDYPAWYAAAESCFVVYYREDGTEPLSALERNSDKAMLLVNRVIGEGGGRTTYRATVARVWNNRGAMHFDMGNPQTAAAAFEQARPIAEALARAHPTVLDHALDLGAIYQNQGHLARLFGKPPEALECFTRAVNLLESSLKPITPRAGAWRYLAVAYAGRATVLAGLNRHEEMWRDLARMREIDSKPDAQHPRLYRGVMLPRPAKPGSPQSAASAAPAQEPSNPAIPYRLGCIYLLDPIAFRQETPLP